MPNLPPTETVSKLDAARRQLATAIELWFNDKDKVSIHTLSYAAYELIHTISQRKGRTQPLLFDADAISPQYRRIFVGHVKRTPNFFKHADHDSDGTIELQPLIAELFFLYCLVGLNSIGIVKNDYELAFWLWFHLNRPELLTEHGRKVFADSFPIDAVAQIRNWAKSEFLDIFLEARRDGGIGLLGNF